MFVHLSHYVSVSGKVGSWSNWNNDGCSGADNGERGRGHRTRDIRCNTNSGKSCKKTEKEQCLPPRPTLTPGLVGIVLFVSSFSSFC